MSVTSQLNDLQELDSAIERDEQTLAQDKARLGDRKVLDTAQAKLEAAQAALADLKRQHREAESEVDDLLSKIDADEKKLYGGTINSPKELSSLQQEIAMEKSHGDELEDKALGIIDKVEQAEQMVAAASAAFRNLEAQWQAEQQRLAAEIESVTASLADLKSDRDDLAGEVEAEALALYEQVRIRRNPAVTRVERGICTNCRVSPSASALQRARGGHPEMCSCGRIIFIA